MIKEEIKQTELKITDGKGSVTKIGRKLDISDHESDHENNLENIIGEIGEEDKG